MVLPTKDELSVPTFISSRIVEEKRMKSHLLPVATGHGQSSEGVKKLNSVSATFISSNSLFLRSISLASILTVILIGIFVGISFGLLVVVAGSVLESTATKVAVVPSYHSTLAVVTAGGLIGLVSGLKSALSNR